MIKFRNLNLEDAPTDVKERADLYLLLAILTVLQLGAITGFMISLWVN